MKKAYILLILLTFVQLFAIGQNNKTKFEIIGTVEGYSNGTKLYLNDLTDNTYNNQIDSVVISNGKFHFSGTIKNKYLIVAISTTDFNDRKRFWLENGITAFTAQKGNFNTAIIVGSKIQNKQNELSKLADTVENSNPIYYHFIKNNPNSIVSAYNLSLFCNTWSKDTLSKLYNSFSKEIKLTEYAKKVNDFIKLNRNIKIGDKFVDFIQFDIENKRIKLSNFKGKVILLEFWGSWCGACREQNPNLLTIYNDYKTKDFEIFGVATETDKTKWINAIKKDGLTWINVTDFKGENNSASLIYGISYYPTNFLIDKNGIIVAKEVYGEELRNWLSKIL